MCLTRLPVNSTLFFSIEDKSVSIMSENFTGHPCMSRNGFLRIAKNVLKDPKVTVTAVRSITFEILQDFFDAIFFFKFFDG